MSRFLLDVNLLIALLDPVHTQHDRAHAWFAATGHAAWATCPLTENGLIRIVGNPRYHNSPGTPAAVAELLSGFRNHPGHEFWPDDISLIDGSVVQTDRLLDSSQVSDTYLLALAAARRGQLATFDRHLVTDAVIGGVAALHLIP